MYHAIPDAGRDWGQEEKGTTDNEMGVVVKNLSASAEDVRNMGSIPGSGRSAGGEPGYPLQYSCPENPYGQRSLAATVHRVAQSRHD